MRVFLAGAAGVMGQRLVPLLVDAGHAVTGTTRSENKQAQIADLGAQPVVVDVFDAPRLAAVLKGAAPDIVIHQLTDLQNRPGTPGYEASLAANAKLRIEGTRNLVAAAKLAGVTRLIAQSIAFVYAPGEGPRQESDPLDKEKWKSTVDGVEALEREILSLPEGIVLRYGFFHGPGTWFPNDRRPPALHVDAAAQAALLAVTKGRHGIYNIAEDDGLVSSEKAKRELGFDAGFRTT